MTLDLRGQDGWSVTYEAGPRKRTVMDLVERPAGDLLVATLTDGSSIPAGPPFVSTIRQVSAQGVLGAEHEVLMGSDWSVLMTDLEQFPGGEVVSVAAARYQPTMSDHQVLVHAIADGGSLSLLLQHGIDESMGGIWHLSARAYLDDGLLISGSLWAPGSPVPNLFLLLRTELQGELTTAVVHGTALGFRVGRHAFLAADGTVRASMNGSIPEGPFASASILRFAPDLTYLDGFAITALSGSGGVHPLDSIIRDDLYMTPLAGDTLVVSGRFGDLTQGMRAALVRLAPDGSFAGTFLPRSEFEHDLVAYRQGHDMTPDGQILFATFENFYPGPPDPELSTVPSRIRVHRLDTLLNPQCEYLVDGFSDNAYYYLTRIKATSDGGVLLMGSRRDLNTMGPPQGWLMKLDPAECMPLGVEEGRFAHGVEVFPNPGRDGFTVVVNGPALHGARLELFDAMGAHVRSAAMPTNTARVDAHDLASGLYVYRITGRDGRLLGSGRWVRE
ncbi:MAG: T9SS type A sorting domain-containing protein [Flavobacteriales bacterium]|nr:T9SS type A sorting domain-containing protein [Flavobacteriales bacterium]